MNKKKFVIVTIIVFLVFIIYFYYKKNNHFPTIEKIIPSNIQQSDYLSYSLTSDGNYIFTNTFEKIDVISGEPVYLPQFLSSFRMAFKLLPLQEFSTFSLSPDDKYLIVSNQTLNDIEVDESNEFLKNKIFDFENNEIYNFKDDINIFSWNPFDTNIFLSDRGIQNIDGTLKIDMEQKIENPILFGNSTVLWDKKTNLPIGLISLNDSNYVISSLSNININLFSTPIEIFLQNENNERNLPIGFDNTGNYLLYIKYVDIGSDIDSTVWLLDWRTSKEIELFRMSDYDSKMPIITNAIWSADGTKILIERYNTNFIVLSLKNNNK